MPGMNVTPGTRPGMTSTAPAGSDWEYAPVRIPSDVTRSLAATMLSMQAEAGGWELAEVRLHRDGTRRVWLRRRPRHRNLPGPVL